MLVLLVCRPQAGLDCVSTFSADRHRPKMSRRAEERQLTFEPGQVVDGARYLHREDESTAAHLWLPSKHEIGK